MVFKQISAVSSTYVLGIGGKFSNIAFKKKKNCIGEYLHDFGTSIDFLNPKSTTLKENMSKWDFLKIKKLSSLKVNTGCK